MQEQEHAPAVKFAPPPLASALPRTALLAQLAQVAAPARWVCAPAGSGKSTLVAQYAAGSGRRVVWYRLDERDDDPRYFFRQLAGEMIRLGARRDATPLFSDADHSREAAFAQGFVRAVVADTAAPWLIVFDDAQRAATEALSARLAQLAQLADDRVRIVFVSETPPPRVYFDAIVARRLSIANDLDLRFTAAECAAMAQALRLTGLSGDDLVALTGGHAGALVLACEFLRGPRSALAADAARIEEVHAHLLERLVAKLPAAQSELLLRTSFLPQLEPALVAALLGRAGVDADLAALAERGLLIRQPQAAATVYEMHGLIRRGARAIARAQTDERVLQQWAEQCAEVLEAHGRLHDAYALWLDIGRRDAALRVLESLAEQAARRQEAQRLLAAVARLPLEDVLRRPWIGFWAGQALAGIDETGARQWYERSYAAFAANGDRAGMALAAAGMLIGFYSFFGDMSSAGVWAEHFRAHKSWATAQREFPQRGQLLLGVLCEREFAADAREDDDLHQAEAALHELIPDRAAWPSRDLQMQAARIWFEHARVHRPIETALQWALAMNPLAEDPAVSPLLRGRWWLRLAEIYILDLGDQERAQAILSRAEPLARQIESHELATNLLRLRVQSSLLSGEVDRAAAELAELERLSEGAPPTDIAMYSRLATRVLLMQRKPREALAQAEAMLRAGEAAGFNQATARAFETTYAYALAANGRAAEAARRLHESAALQSGEVRDVLLSVAYCLNYLGGDGTDLIALARGLNLAVRTAYGSLLFALPDQLAYLCDVALANDIETEFVHKLIRTQRLVPPPGASAAWPWAVRIWTLGAFRLEIDGQPYRPAHKAQDKPLELLKLLVAVKAGARGEADKPWLAEQLWPEADAENARKSLDMTIARLRRLLGHEAAIEVIEGKVGLAPAQVWTDVQPFLHAAARLESRRGAPADATVDRLRSDLTALVASYGGQFLPGDEETTWLLGARANLARVFRMAIMAAEPALVARADTGLVLALERAVVAEPLAEDLVRALMRVYLARGEHAEALRAYRRCRDMLSVTLGVAPSAQTEEIRRLVYGAAQGGAAAPRA